MLAVAQQLEQVSNRTKQNGLMIRVKDLRGSCIQKKLQIIKQNILKGEEWRPEHVEGGRENLNEETRKIKESNNNRK